MKIKILILILAICLLSISIYAQHIIIKKDKTIIHARVHEMKSEKVVYELHGSLHDLEKEKVKYITDENGKIIFIDALKETTTTTQPVDNKIFSDEIEEETLPQRKIIINCSPLAAFESYTSLQGGIEFKLKDEFSLLQDASYIFGSNLNGVEKAEGIAYKTELKYYFQRSSPMNGWYIAPQFTYRYVKTNGTVDYNNIFSGTYLPHSKSELNTYGTNMKLGFQFTSSIGFVFDFFTGFGMKLNEKNTKYSLDDSSEKEITINDKFSEPKFVLGLRIGWAL